MRRCPKGYKITRVGDDEIARLVEVNLAADQLFAGSGLVDDDDLRRHIPKDVFSAAILARDMFAARHVETAELVGFTLTS
ncbi:MAG: hypothetical protein AAF216_01800, partial [Pseudomonadota bacterium]